MASWARGAARAPYARVLACATNNDGHTKEGITFPSGPAQRALAQEVSHACLGHCLFLSCGMLVPLKSCLCFAQLSAFAVCSF